MSLRLVILLKWQSCFPVSFAKILKTTFLQTTSERLILNIFEFLSSYRIDVRVFGND